MARQILNNGEFGSVVRSKLNSNFEELYRSYLRGAVDAAEFGVVPGGTDLHTKLQQALEQAGTVTLSQSITLTGQVMVPSNCRLIQTAGTITLNLGSTVTPAFVLDSVDNVRMCVRTFTQSSGRPIDISNCTNVRVFDSFIDHGANESLVGGGANGGIGIVDSHDVHVVDTEVKNCRTTQGISAISGNSHIRITGCRVSNVARAGISISSGNEDVVISGCVISGTNKINIPGAADGAIDVYGASAVDVYNRNIKIVDNTVYGVGGIFGAMTIGPSLIRVVSCEDLLVSGNSLRASGRCASLLTVFARENVPVERGRFVDNYLEEHVDGCELSIVTIGGFDEFFHKDLTFERNTLVARASSAATPHFIRFRNKTVGIRFAGNVYRDLGGGRVGIASTVDVGHEDVVVDGERFYGASNALDLRFVDNVRVVNLDGTRLTGRLYNLTSNNTVYLANNKRGATDNIFTSNTDVINAETMPRISADKGNSSASVPSIGSTEGIALWNTPFTAARTCTLVTSGILPDTRQRIVRTAAATGAFVLNVGAGPLTTLDAGQWAEVQFNGTAWILIGKGSL